jgi:hypothetical protein
MAPIPDTSTPPHEETVKMLEKFVLFLVRTYILGREMKWEGEGWKWKGVIGKPVGAGPRARPNREDESERQRQRRINGDGYG